jgi:hypothetical protein
MAFGEPSQLFREVDAEMHKQVEFDDGLSQRIDGMVKTIQDTPDGEEKKELFEKLILHVHKILRRDSNLFYKKFEDLLKRNHVTKEDVYSEGVKIVLESTKTWKDKKTRIDQGEQPAGFMTFVFFGGFQLFSGLRAEFVAPFQAKMRKGETISIYDRAPNQKSDETILETLESEPDENGGDGFSHTLRNEERQQVTDTVLNKLYSDEDPLLSLIVILRFGLPVIKVWEEKFAQSLEKGEIKETVQRHVPKFAELLKQYQGKPMTLEQIGSSLGVSGEDIRQKGKRALDKLKEELKDTV